MNVYEPRNIRNVLLVGHSGSGKTTLTEALSFAAGAVTRMGKIEDGNTVSDHDAEEIRRGISVSLSLVPIEWSGMKINIMDAPGYADFIGDVKGALRAADVCLFVVSAVDGVEVQTEELARSLRQARRDGVIDRIGGDELVQRGQVLLINDLIIKSLNKSLVVICCHRVSSLLCIHGQVILIPPSA